MQANKMRQFQLISNPSPPVRWAGTLILLATLTHLAASLRANSGITDPWGENQRPKLYTDYLTQHSGKNWIVFTYILKKNLCTCSKHTSVKFIYSDKATKFCEISTLLLTTVHTVKSKVEILQNFVAFSEYMNFI